jgi:RimJ/RimL family protein N-acetyltransferase
LLRFGEKYPVFFNRMCCFGYILSFLEKLEMTMLETQGLQERLNLALQRCQANDFASAYQILREAKASLVSGMITGTDAQLDELRLHLWELQPHWWACVRHGQVNLRRMTADDAPFVASCYDNIEFKQKYNRQRPWSGDLSEALARAGQLPPAALGCLHWVVCLQDQPIGLASLGHLSFEHQRAEFSIGFPHRPTPTIACKASLMVMHYAYFVLGLHKLCTGVYATNPQAIHNTERLGFAQEGVLIDQCWFPDTGFVDVHVFGLTKSALLQNQAICRLAQRLLGESWH